MSAFYANVATCPWCERRLNTGGLIPRCSCYADRHPHEEDPLEDEFRATKPVRKRQPLAATLEDVLPYKLEE